MKIAVLGTGEVGRQLGAALVGSGHEVALGSRRADHPGAAAWAREVGPGARHDSFAGAARWAELVINATGGSVSLAALVAAGPANLSGKVVIDVSNPLDFTGGAPRLAVPEAGSVAEEIQQAFPSTRVVKMLNTMNNTVMVDPGRIPGPHHVFVCGGDPAAKAAAAGLLAGFGWRPEQIVDLGPLSAARGTEAAVLFWVAIAQARGDADFNFAIAEAPKAEAPVH